MDFPGIIFDVDNVLADTMTSFCRKASELLGHEVNKQQIKDHKIIGSIPLPPHVIFSLQSEVWAEWRKLRPLEDDLQGKLHTFQKIGFEVYIAASSPSRLKAYVKEWIEELEIPHNGFFHCAENRSKSDIKAEALVDDAPEEIKRFQCPGRQAFLYLQPWNSRAKISDAILVNNIDEVLRHYGFGKGKNGAYRDIRWLGKNGI